MVFLSQKVDGNMIFTDYWKVLVLNFSVMGNTVFFESRSWWKDDIYWLLRSSCFELFGDGKYSLFFSQKVDGKMIFTWSFWAFHNIPGLGKYCFSCSAVFKDQAKFDTQNLVISSLLTQIEISKKQKEKEIQKQ